MRLVEKMKAFARLSGLVVLGSLISCLSAQAEQVQVPGEHAALSSAACGTAAPICCLADLLKSTLVQKGGWPGIGPFKASTGSSGDLVDASGNHLRLTSSGDQVTAVELSISKEAEQDFLDLQMACNFLLEAVGSKEWKIARLNLEMEKNKQAILNKSDAQPLTLHAGHYLVDFQRETGGAAGNVSYLIKITSSDASQDAIKQHANSRQVAPPLPEGKPPESKGKPESTAKSGATGDALQNEFACVIKNWQKVKKKVVRNRLPEELPQILYGRALQRQKEALKWLTANHKYYEIAPLGATVYSYKVLAPGSRYLVSSQVKESSKLFDEASGKVLKESNDTYKVNYTIEKVGDRWLISDSAIVAAGDTQPAARPDSKSGP